MNDRDQKCDVSMCYDLSYGHDQMNDRDQMNDHDQMNDRGQRSDVNMCYDRDVKLVQQCQSQLYTVHKSLFLVLMHV